jgi:ABC-type sulfate transport system permease subunit
MHNENRAQASCGARVRQTLSVFVVVLALPVNVAWIILLSWVIYRLF